MGSAARAEASRETKARTATSTNKCSTASFLPHQHKSSHFTRVFGKGYRRLREPRTCPPADLSETAAHAGSTKVFVAHTGYSRPSAQVIKKRVEIRFRDVFFLKVLQCIIDQEIPRSGLGLHTRTRSPPSTLRYTVNERQPPAPRPRTRRRSGCLARPPHTLGRSPAPPSRRYDLWRNLTIRGVFRWNATWRSRIHKNLQLSYQLEARRRSLPKNFQLIRRCSCLFSNMQHACSARRGLRRP